MSQPRITLAEACDIVARLEPRLPAPSYWQIRHLDVALGVIDPGRAVVNGQLRTRLLDPSDVMLVRLFWRIAFDSVQPSARVAGAIANRREALCEVFRQRLDRVLVIRGTRGDVVAPDTGAVMAGEVYPLVDVAAGVVAAMRAVRREQPEVWTGCRLAKPGELITCPSSQAAFVTV